LPAKYCRPGFPGNSGLRHFTEPTWGETSLPAFVAALHRVVQSMALPGYVLQDHFLREVFRFRSIPKPFQEKRHQH